LGNNALSNLIDLSLSYCRIGDDGFMALVSAPEQNTSLLQRLICTIPLLSVNWNGPFLALAQSLPEIKVLRPVRFDWCAGLALAMPLLLAGLRKSTSLFRIHVANWAPDFVGPTNN
jgi:energy-converting hydrogenase Eha subunit A